MPQFILDDDGDVNGTEFADLDSFTQGFIECGFFLSESPRVETEEFLTDEHQEAMREGTTDGTIPCDVGFSDLEPESLATMIELCRGFQAKAARLLDMAYGRDYEPEQAGRDYWFTHTGSGVGFWDRKELEGDLGTALSNMAGRGEFYLEFNPNPEGNGGTVYFTGY